MRMPFERMNPRAHDALLKILTDATVSVTINDRQDSGTVALSDDLVPVQRVQDARWLVTYVAPSGPVTVVKLNADGTMVHLLKDMGGM